MIEGLALLAPWQEAIRRKTQAFANCTDCKAGTSEMVRQSMACPYEAAPPEGLRPFVRPPDVEGATVTPTVCPGYTTSLPEVIELARAWDWREHGSLRDFCGGYPTEATKRGVELFAGYVADLKHKLMTPRSKGGLADE